MPTPKKGPRFGKDPAHQRLLHGEPRRAPLRGRGHRHDRGEGEGAAAVRREADHAGQEGRRPRPPPGRSRRSTTRTSPTSSSPRSRRATSSGPAGTCAFSSSARARATTRRWRVSSWCDPVRRGRPGARVHGSSGSSSPTTAPTSTASPRSPIGARSQGCSSRRSSRRCGRRSSGSPAPGAPTPVCTRWGQVVSFRVSPPGATSRSTRTPPSDGQPPTRARDRRAGGRPSPRPGSTPGVRRAGGTIATRSSTARTGSVPRPLRVVGRRARSTCRSCAWAPIPSSASTTSLRSAARVRPGAPRSGGCSSSHWATDGRRGAASTTSTRAPSAGRWSARSSACSSRSGRAGAGRATSWRSSGPGTAPRRPVWRLRRGCASARSVTTSRRGLAEVEEAVALVAELRPASRSATSQSPLTAGSFCSIPWSASEHERRVVEDAGRVRPPPGCRRRDRRSRGSTPPRRRSTDHRRASPRRSA